jgi:hypothetical protein
MKGNLWQRLRALTGAERRLLEAVLIHLTSRQGKVPENLALAVADFSAFTCLSQRLDEIALVLVPSITIARVIVSANHGIMKSALSLFIEPRLTLRSP